MYGYNFQSYQPRFDTPKYQMPTTQDERIWVQNEIAAEAYLVAPNGFVRLWDSSKPVFYEKRADQTGRPLPTEVYEYKRREAQTVASITSNDNFIMQELESLKARLEALEKGVSYADDDERADEFRTRVQRRSKGTGIKKDAGDGAEPEPAQSASK